jgi:hypothetical protein
VVWAVAKGSLRNKLILVPAAVAISVPAAVAISALAPWAVTPLLLAGGLFLVYEGVEKLAHLGMAAPTVAPATAPREVLRLVEVFDREHADDRLVRAWRSFEAISAGEPIGLRRDGSPVAAPADGFVVFPNPNAMPGAEWFYFAVPSARRL